MKKVTKQTYINWYKDMLFWRKFEDKLAAVYIQQKVRGFLHLYNGQEAGNTKRLEFFEKDAIQWKEHKIGSLYKKLFSLLPIPDTA